MRIFSKKTGSETRDNGLKFTEHTIQALEHLESENGQHGFRYFSFRNTGKPDLSWLLASAEELISKVKIEVDKLEPKENNAVLKITFGKPVPK